MPVSLTEAARNATDDLDVMVIDEFRKSSWLLDNLVFDDVVNPAGGGATLTYTYRRLVTQPTAAYRAFNTEYTPSEVTTARYSVDLAILGGSFEIDRVLAKIGPAASGQVALQMSQKIKAARTFFQDQVINGDSAVDADGFDGLDVALTGSSTEWRSTTVSDWTDWTDPADARAGIDDLDEFLSLLDGEPSALLGNKKTIARVRSMARAAGYYTRSENAFGQSIERYGNIVLVDLGDKAGSNSPIIPIETRDPNNSVHTVTITGGPSGGTFTITVTVPGGTGQTTVGIAYNATAGAVEDAIEALSNVGAGNVTVTGSGGGPYTIEFTGDLEKVPVTLTANGSGLTGGTTPDAAAAESGTGAVSGLTDLYAVRLGLDGFHGVSTAGGQLVSQWLPDFNSAGAVKKGEVEMGPLAVVLKATKAAAVWRNIKVQ